MKAVTAQAPPYPGLRFYTEGDAPFFFGRERLRDLIISNLRSSRLTLVFGPSGVGKSSVLRAGVANKLRELAQDNVDETGKPEFAVAVFNRWRDEPIAGLTAAVEDATRESLGGQAIQPPPSSFSLVEKLGWYAAQVGGDLLIILDQFEDYFLYHGHEEGKGAFVYEFARAVNDPGLRVNFLVSIRDDAYSKLEYLKQRISNIYSNSLRIEHLDTEAARSAIEKPIDQYNRFYAAGIQRMSIEPQLIEEVLRTVRTGRLTLGEVGHGTIKQQRASIAPKTTVEAPFLQLVMTELWREEIVERSTTLRLQTLNGLGGAKEIVRSHLTRVMDTLPDNEKALAAGAFNFLVTSSGNKIAYSASDLAEAAELDANQLVLLLEKLASSRCRILRSSAPLDHEAESRYEIFHDVLAKAVLDWRTQYREQQKLAEESRRAAQKARTEAQARYIGRLLVLSIALAIALVVAIGATFLAIRYYREAEKARHQAVVAGNVHSQILADLYQVIIQPGHPQRATENLEDTLKSFSELLAVYEQDNNLAGAGITRNNIGGIYKAAGEAEAGLKHYEKSREYYQEAREYYSRARELLETALGPSHPDVATSFNELGDVAMRLGDYAEAEKNFGQSLKILESYLGSEDRDVADASMNLAECYSAEGKFPEAERLYIGALTIRRQKLREGHPEIIACLTGLASLSLERGKYSIAQQQFNEALTIWKESANPQPLDAVPIYNALAAIRSDRGDFGGAEEYLKQARDAHKEFVANNHLLVADDLENLALLRQRENKPGTEKETESLFTMVLGIRDKSLGKDHPDTALAASNLGFFFLKQGRLGPAEDVFIEARKIQEVLPDSPALRRTLYGLATVYRDQGRYDDAEQLFKSAVDLQAVLIERFGFSSHHPDFADVRDAYAELLYKTGREAEANSMKQTAENLRQRHKEENSDN